MATRRKRTGKHQAQAQAPSATLLAALGYTFRDPALLQLALTHRSFVYESRSVPDVRSPREEPSPEMPSVAAVARSPAPRLREGRNPPGSDNEQLEFLGDAVLGLVVTDLLYCEFPDRSEGELTRMRASLVSRDRLAALGTELGLPEYLRLGRSAEENGARTKPAVIADVTEAVLAAVYLDAMAPAAKQARTDALGAVRPIVRERLLEPALNELHAALREDNGRGALRDFKTLLQERVQAGNAGRLHYVDVAEEGPPHQRRFTVEARLQAGEQAAEQSAVLATAEGASKKEAQQRAAESALAAWPPPVLASATSGERSA